MSSSATIVHGGEGGKALALTLPPGDLGTDISVLAMRACAEDAAEHSRAVSRLAHTLGGSPQGIGQALYDWLSAHVRFKRDGRGLEHVRHPDVLLSQIARDGIAQVDCDCLATLACAVLVRSGSGAAFIVAARAPAPAPFEHVFYAALPRSATPPAWRLPDDILPRSAVPCDPQERVPPGSMPPGVRRFRVYPL